MYEVSHTQYVYLLCINDEKNFLLGKILNLSIVSFSLSSIPRYIVLGHS